MKAVLISIRPQWCELIAAGRKTIEVRKTRPKLDTPFKVYVYCTADAVKHIVFDEYGDRQIELVPQMIIGEFVCDKIFDICMEISDVNGFHGCPFPGTGLLDIEIVQYLGNGETGYGWHISELVIYDKPKRLSCFRNPCVEYEKDYPQCGDCDYYRSMGEYPAECNCDGQKPLRRPPQSWCYVEELPKGE